MYRDLPIEQLVRRKGMAFQFAIVTRDPGGKAA